MDTVLADYHLGDGIDGLELLRSLREPLDRSLDAALISADHDAELALQARTAGFHLLYKPLRPAALRALLCAGRLNKQIGHDLQITEATVKAHMTVILRKLGAANRTQAVLLAGRLARDPSEIKTLPDGIE